MCTYIYTFRIKTVCDELGFLLVKKMAPYQLIGHLDADNFVLILPKECHALRVEINAAAIKSESIKSSTIVGVHLFLLTHFNENVMEKYFSCLFFCYRINFPDKM